MTTFLLFCKNSLKNSPLTLLAGMWIAVILISAFIFPTFFPSNYIEPSLLRYSPPTWTHPFGTDLHGRDLLYRVLTGTRLSFIVGFCAASVSLIVGSCYGLIAGYFGGRIDALLMRLVDIFYAIPRLIFILVLITTFNKKLQLFALQYNWKTLITYSPIVILMISLGIIEWLTLARMVRGQVLSLKTRLFVLAARALGQSHLRILWSHLLPNLSSLLIVYLMLTLPAVIIDESFLSFLGLGIQAPQASLGSLLANGASALNPIRPFWWLLVFPASFLVTLLISLHFLSDKLYQTLNPQNS